MDIQNQTLKSKLKASREAQISLLKSEMEEEEKNDADLECYVEPELSNIELEVEDIIFTKRSRKDQERGEKKKRKTVS